MEKVDHGLSDEQLEALRARVHRLSDMVQGHEGTLREHKVLLEHQERAHSSLAARAATQEQLGHARGAMTTELAAAVAQLTLQIGTVKDDLAPIKRGVYWAVTLILGALILAMMTLLLNGAPPRGIGINPATGNPRVTP